MAQVCNPSTQTSEVEALPGSNEVNINKVFLSWFGFVWGFLKQDLSM